MKQHLNGSVGGSAPVRRGPGLAFFLLLVLTYAGCQDPATTEDLPEAASDVAESPAPKADVSNNLAVEVFTDVAADAGIDFVHFNGMSGEYYITEVKCGGAGLFDFDNDGDLDVYLVQGAMLGEGKTLADATFPPKGPLPPSDRLYRNDLVIEADGSRTLQFTDVTDAAGIKATRFGLGVAAGDIDNDGWIDLYVTNLGSNQMYRNNGDGTFTDVTEQTGSDDPRYNTSAAFLDFDRDGWLDLFVCAYVNFNYATHAETYTVSGRRDYSSPLAYQLLPDRLFRNRRDGTFEDVSTTARIVREYGAGLGVSCADFNGDGWIDIYVANDQCPNQLWINQHDGTFRNDALLAGCALNVDGKSEASMGVDAGDFDADGDEDLFMTHLTNESNTIYINDGSGLFEDQSNRTGLGIPSMAYTAFGTAWFDYDNDGWLDLFVANGAVQTIEALARANDPYPLHQPNQLFHNRGNGSFEDVSNKSGAVFALSEVSRAAAFGDVDNDGDLDVLVGNNNGPVRLLINAAAGNNVGDRQPWLGLRMVGADGKRDMLGTRVAVHRAKGPVLWRRVRADASYCATNDPRVLVGLGDSADVTALRAYWPDGSIEQWDKVALNTYTTLRQGSGTPVNEP